jgi:hypothetical protein
MSTYPTLLIPFPFSAYLASFVVSRMGASAIAMPATDMGAVLEPTCQTLAVTPEKPAVVLIHPGSSFRAQHRYAGSSIALRSMEIHHSDVLPVVGGEGEWAVDRRPSCLPKLGHAPVLAERTNNH